MARTYKVERGGLHDRFQKSRAKVQMFAGGFGNGKTTGAVVKALQIAREYPGSNGLVARSTYPKLNSTIRKEFEAWCPKAWIKRNVNSKENLIELQNGSVINFSYIAQGGKNTESSTSNLLSATYDWVVVDQVEDPEIAEKDFLDLLGRLRGQTLYTGDDETMPTTGPRWIILMCNPTRNWVYRSLVKPLHDYNRTGIRTSQLLWDEEAGKPMIEIFEGSTYENATNLPADFIATQEAAYKGQMRARFLQGEWGAYEGLVYPQYDAEINQINHDWLVEYLNECRASMVRISFTEAYDHGLAQPACYGFMFNDHLGNTFLLDGVYEKEKSIGSLATAMKDCRKLYDYDPAFDNDSQKVLADPSIFRRVSGKSSTVGTTTAGLFREHGIEMQRANNDILNGIAKVQAYLELDNHHRHPLTGELGAPKFYVSTKCDWFDREIVDYYWRKDTAGEYEDVPMDRNDHAMDMVKYAFTSRPRIATIGKVSGLIPSRYRQWREQEASTTAGRRKHRYG